MSPINISDYLRYRAKTRGFDLTAIENILRYSQERYFDNDTHRYVAVGKHNDSLLMIPYEQSVDGITPITVHTTTRQQLKFRLKTGRLSHE